MIRFYMMLHMLPLMILLFSLPIDAMPPGFDYFRRDDAALL